MTDSLDAFVERATAQLADDPKLSARNVQLRIVEALLETLGWDLRSSDVEAAYTLGDDRTVDYVLLVAGYPAVVVETAGAADSLSEPRERLVKAIESMAVDGGIATNGRRFAFRSAGGDEAILGLEDLVERATLVRGFSKESVYDRYRKRANERVASAISAEHERAVAEITDVLATIAGAESEPLVRPEAEQFVDELVAALHEGAPRKDSSAVVNSVGGTTAETDADIHPDAETDPDANTNQKDGGSGEYVVRFFEDRASVGAVGGQTPGGAFYGAVSYLIEERALGSALTVPWVLDGEPIVAVDAAVLSATASAELRELPDGTLLRTDLDDATMRTALQDLAEIVGLRVMFQGDW